MKRKGIAKGKKPFSRKRVNAQLLMEEVERQAEDVDYEDERQRGSTFSSFIKAVLFSTCLSLFFIVFLYLFKVKILLLVIASVVVWFSLTALSYAFFYSFSKR